jgi:hypothetical protein
MPHLILPVFLTLMAAATGKSVNPVASCKDVACVDKAIMALARKPGDLDVCDALKGRKSKGQALDERCWERGALAAVRQRAVDGCAAADGRANASVVPVEAIVRDQFYAIPAAERPYEEFPEEGENTWDGAVVGAESVVSMEHKTKPRFRMALHFCQGADGRQHLYYERVEFEHKSGPGASTRQSAFIAKDHYAAIVSGQLPAKLLGVKLRDSFFVDLDRDGVVDLLLIGDPDVLKKQVPVYACLGAKGAATCRFSELTLHAKDGFDLTFFDYAYLDKPGPARTVAVHAASVTGDGETFYTQIKGDRLVLVAKPKG